MNKTEALANLAELKKQANELEKQIQSMPEDRAPSLLTKPKPGSCDDYWKIATSSEYGGLEPHLMTAASDDERWYKHGNLFATAEQAKAYAEAIDTMLLLRHQPGTVSPGDKEVWVIQPNNRATDVYPDNWTAIDLAVRNISPAFVSRDTCAAAVKTVGRDRILRMFKILHHVTD